MDIYYRAMVYLGTPTTICKTVATVCSQRTATLGVALNEYPKHGFRSCESKGFEGCALGREAGRNLVEETKHRHATSRASNNIAMITNNDCHYATMTTPSISSHLRADFDKADDHSEIPNSSETGDKNNHRGDLAVCATQFRVVLPCQACHKQSQVES